MLYKQEPETSGTVCPNTRRCGAIAQSEVKRGAFDAVVESKMGNTGNPKCMS